MARPLLFLIKVPAAKEDSIRAFERRWELRLAAAYRHFLLEYNGGLPASANEFFPVPLRFRKFHEEFGKPPDELAGVGVAEFRSIGKVGRGSLEKIMDLLTRTDQLPPHCIPIASDGCGNNILLSVGGDQQGQLIFLERSLEQYPIADSFEEFLEGLTCTPKDTNAKT